MKIGIGLRYSGAQIDIPVRLVQRAEQLGYESVWTAEAFGSDALTPLAYLAGQTTRIKLGTAIAQLAARTPANLAMSAQTLDALAGRGRALIGIGVSGPQIVEGWYGQPGGRPADRLRDYTAIMKKIWKREGPVVHAGPEISLPYDGPGSSGLGKPLKSILHGNPNIPVLIGATTPGNIRLAGEIADGWLPSEIMTIGVRKHLASLEAGIALRKDGKTLKDFRIQGQVSVVLTDNLSAAFAEAKNEVALYVGGMGSKDKNFHKENMIRRGYAEVAERVQELFLAGKKAEAAAAIPDEFVDEGTLIGSAARIRERWKMWRDLPLTGITINRPTEPVLELMAQVAVEAAGGI